MQGLNPGLAQPLGGGQPQIMIGMNIQAVAAIQESSLREIAANFYLVNPQGETKEEQIRNACEDAMMVFEQMNGVLKRKDEEMQAAAEVPVIVPST